MLTAELQNSELFFIQEISLGLSYNWSHLKKMLKHTHTLSLFLSLYNASKRPGCTTGEEGAVVNLLTGSGNRFGLEGRG
jgi:hypothetical protein